MLDDVQCQGQPDKQKEGIQNWLICRRLLCSCLREHGKELVGPWILTKNDYKRRHLSKNLRLGKNAGAVPRLGHVTTPCPLEAA